MSNSSDNTTVNAGTYVDVSKIQGSSTEASQRTALASLNNFLKEMNSAEPAKYPHSQLDLYSSDELLNFREAFGRYPDYMMKKQKIMLATAKSYLSQNLKTIVTKCEKTDISQPTWYKNLRTKTCKMYSKHHSDTNTKKSNPAPPMSSEDLADLCELLFVRNSIKSIQERALLVLQWQALGRVSETTALSYDSLGWHDGYDALAVQMNREKVNIEHTIHCFLHSSNWLICPLHALGMRLTIQYIECILTHTHTHKTASMIALAGSGSHLFPFVPENGAAAHVNAVLRDLETTERDNARFARAIKKFTSHSGRSGFLPALFLTCRYSGAGKAQ